MPGGAAIRGRRGYTGWELPEAERRALLGRFAPAYPTLVAHHATHSYGVGERHPLPKETAGTVIGVADDGEGVQALVLEIGGGGMRRPDGSAFHITWSLGPGRKPRESNDVIAKLGWTAVEPVAVRLVPRFFPF